MGTKLEAGSGSNHLSCVWTRTAGHVHVQAVTTNCHKCVCDKPPAASNTHVHTFRHGSLPKLKHVSCSKVAARPF